METSSEIGLWVIAFLLFTIIISLNIFYIKKLVENWRKEKTMFKSDASVTEQRKKLKAEIISDLEKKLEAL